MFGKHKAIERFSIMFTVLVICMSTLMGSIVWRKQSQDADTLSRQAKYTTQVKMSRSHVTGEVVDVMVNKDQTKTFVLWRMDSMSDMSADAEDYMMFLTGSNERQRQETLKSRPSGGIYVFGVSGYMGAYLVNNTPFESQILNLVVRGLKDYSSQTGANGEQNIAEVPSGADASFEKFDQMQIYFNPGATDARHVKFLDADVIDVEDMYEEAVAQAKKAQVRNQLSQDLQTMYEAQRKAENEASRLTEKGTYGVTLAPLDVPAEMKNDTIRAYSKKTQEELTWSEGDGMKGQNGWIDKDGNKLEKDDYYLDLDTDYVFDGGYDFAWQTDVKGGYLPDLIGSLSVDEYFKKQNDLLSQLNDEGNNTLGSRELEFYYSDGNPFVADVQSDDSKLQNISKGVDNLKTAWKTYYDTKVAFQTAHLKQLLDVERDANIVTKTYSDNFEEGVLVNY